MSEFDHSEDNPARAFRVLVTLVRRCLDTERDECSGDFERTELTGIAELARAHRLEGLLLRYQDSLGLAPAVIRQLESTTDLRAHQGLSQWAATLSLSRLLDESSMPHLIFKGRALTAQTEAEADIRGGGDVDLLVSPENVPRAHALLVAHGFDPVYAIEPRTRWGWSFVTFRNREMPYRSNLAEIDLHWRIAPEREILPDTQTLLRRKTHVGREGQEIPTLAAIDALAACAFHFYHDYGSALRRLVDFVRLSRLVTPAELDVLPRASRKLISDVGAVCRVVFGESSVDVSITTGFSSSQRDYLLDLLYSAVAGFSHQGRSANPLQRAVMNFRHVSHYTRVPALLPRLIARGMVWFPYSTPGHRGWSIPRAIGQQCVRVLRGQFDSYV